MSGRGLTIPWVVLAMLVIAAVLLLATFALRGCSQKHASSSRAAAPTQPPPQNNRTEQAGEVPWAESAVPGGGEGEPAKDFKGERQDAAKAGASGQGDGDSKTQASRKGQAEAQTDTAGDSAGTSDGTIPDQPESGAGKAGAPRTAEVGPARHSEAPGTATGSWARSRGAGSGDNGGGDPLSDAGISPEQLSRAISAARDAAAKARQAAQRGNHRQAYQSALAGWKQVRGLARFDKEAAGAARELLGLIELYGKQLEGETERAVPMDETPLITR